MSCSPDKSVKFSDSQHYELLESVEADGAIPVSYYVNKITGLKIFLAYLERPMVKGDFAFATETHDDDGLPHTLEHLIYLGSEQYPFKGVLDLLANRSFADGTNAYTDTDHTSYSLITAGAEGFLSLLPIYLDHLFFPLLTEHAYLTEVHHINGRGEDAGVVYCEMQAIENTGDQRCQLEMLRAMYPGKCGYKSNTGGIMENIRKSLNNDKIRDYHSKYYVPKNCCLIISGPVTPEALFKALKPIEDKLHSRFIAMTHMERPWSSEVPPLEKSIIKTIEYPCDTEDDGLVYLGYRGPDSDDFEECVAITLLTEYLNQPSISPFQREFVENDQPFCSNIDDDLIENTKCIFYFTFESVRIELIAKVVDKVHEILNKLVSGEEAFDTERMNLIIDRRKVNLLLSCEMNPHSHIMNASLSHFLYGKASMKDKYQTNRILNKFESVDKHYWLGLITKYMVGPGARYVCVNGLPSPKILETIMKENERRIKDRIQCLGKDLVLKEKALQEAKEFNDRPVPSQIFTETPVPSINNIKFFNIQTSTCEDPRLPITIRYDKIQTNFVTVFVAINTSHCFNDQDRLYIPILEQLLLECPIFRDGKLIPHQDIVRELFADTVSYGVSTGISGTLSNIFVLNLNVEEKKYSKVVKWIHEILFNTKFPVERIKTIAKRMLGDISQVKRQGEPINCAVSTSLIYRKNSNNAAQIFMKQEVFLKSLLKKLKSEPQDVESELTRVRDVLTNNPKNIYCHLSLNANHFPSEEDVTKPWFDFLPYQNIEKKFFQQSDIVQNYDLIKMVKGDVSGLLIPSGSVESSYLLNFVSSIKDPHHCDLAPILVLIKYLTQLEGPLWRQIRGEGLSYNYGIELNPSSGLMYLAINRSNQLVEAFKKTVEVVTSHLDGSVPYEDHLLQSAKSSLIFKFICREKNPASKTKQSLTGFLLNIGTDYDRNMLAKIENVKIEDLQRVGNEHLSSLFHGDTRIFSVCCNHNESKVIQNSLNSLGCNLTYSSLDSIVTNEGLMN